MTAIANMSRAKSGIRLPLTVTALSLCLTAGVLLGYDAAVRHTAAAGEEFRRYLDGYLLLASHVIGARSVLRTLVCYFRAPLLAFLLGFASIGVVLLPVLCAFEGFLFAFSLCCFSASFGRGGFVLLLALFAVRLLFVLPCTLCVSAAAMDKAKALALFSVGSGKRVRPVTYGSAYWYRFGIVCVCLLIGSVLELWLVPLLLSLLA